MTITKGGDTVRQSSTDFMAKMLEDNTKATPSNNDLSDQIAARIDECMDKAMSKFTAALTNVNVPDQEHNNSNESEDPEHEQGRNEEGSREDGEEGTIEEVNN